MTLKDPKRKSLRRRRRHVTTHETLCRYVIATDTTASDYLDTLSRITTGTWCESGDFAKPSLAIDAPVLMKVCLFVVVVVVVVVVLI